MRLLNERTKKLRLPGQPRKSADSKIVILDIKRIDGRPDIWFTAWKASTGEIRYMHYEEPEEFPLLLREPGDEVILVAAEGSTYDEHGFVLRVHRFYPEHPGRIIERCTGARISELLYESRMVNRTDPAIVTRDEDGMIKHM